MKASLRVQIIANRNCSASSAQKYSCSQLEQHIGTELHIQNIEEGKKNGACKEAENDWCPSRTPLSRNNCVRSTVSTYVTPLCLLIFRSRSCLIPQLTHY